MREISSDLIGYVCLGIPLRQKFALIIIPNYYVFAMKREKLIPNYHDRHNISLSAAIVAESFPSTCLHPS